MIKNQKGLSALVIVIIIAVIIAILLIITLLLNDQEKSQPTPAPDSETEIKLEDAEILRTERVLIPLENIPPDFLEWLEVTYPDLVEHYAEEGIPMEILEGLTKARNAQYEGADE